MSRPSPVASPHGLRREGHADAAAGRIADSSKDGELAPDSPIPTDDSSSTFVMTLDRLEKPLTWYAESRDNAPAMGRVRRPDGLRCEVPRSLRRPIPQQQQHEAEEGWVSRDSSFKSTATISLRDEDLAGGSLSFRTNSFKSSKLTDKPPEEWAASSSDEMCETPPSVSRRGPRRSWNQEL
eukprot:4031840-Prymnesium_polylepis.2